MCIAPENAIFTQKFAMSVTPVYFIVYQARIIWCEQIFVLHEFFVRGYHCIKLRKRKKKGQLLGDVSHDSPVGVLLFSCCLFQLCNHGDTRNWIFRWVCSMFSGHNMLNRDGYLSVVFRLLVYVGKS